VSDKVKESGKEKSPKHPGDNELGQGGQKSKTELRKNKMKCFNFHIVW
jgi:hypothetical protein